MYRTLTTFLRRFFSQATLFKYGFNLSPMYRRSTGRVVSVSDDLTAVDIRIPLNWRNANFVGSMFGGSMLSATDPILMIQLMHILGDDYVVWDRSVEMRFRRPARSQLQARFVFTEEELAEIRRAVADEGEIDWTKTVTLTGEDGTVHAEGSKILYVASKEHYRRKRGKT